MVVPVETAAAKSSVDAAAAVDVRWPTPFDSIKNKAEGIQHLLLPAAAQIAFTCCRKVLFHHHTAE